MGGGLNVDLDKVLVVNCGPKSPNLNVEFDICRLESQKVVIYI